MAIKLKHVLIAVGIVFVIIGHLGNGMATREGVFWLGVLLSLVRARLSCAHDYPPLVHCGHLVQLPPRLRHVGLRRVRVGVVATHDPGRTTT